MGRAHLLSCLRVFLVLVASTVPAMPLDEGILTPTVGTSMSQDDQEFQDAMAVWYKHDYVNGEKALRKFARV